MTDFSPLAAALLPDTTVPLVDFSEFQAVDSTLLADQPAAIVIAQIESDILGDLSSAFRNFVDSGQVWALIIGIVLGYVVRGITTYR